jgi:hypothetical protein
MFKRYLRNNDIILDTKDIVEMIVIIFVNMLESVNRSRDCSCYAWLMSLTSSGIALSSRFIFMSSS